MVDERARSLREEMSWRSFINTRWKNKRPCKGLQGNTRADDKEMHEAHGADADVVGSWKTMTDTLRVALVRVHDARGNEDWGPLSVWDGIVGSS